MRDLSGVIKAYDVRGVVGEQIDDALAFEIGAAFTALLPDADAVVLGRDMRPSSPGLLAAFADGVSSRGLDVVDIGLASTDQLYFASGHLGLPGAMFTASHNPARYNGIKLCRAGAAPVGQDSGLTQIREAVEAGDLPPAADRAGSVRQIELLAEYAAHLRSLVDLTAIRPLTVVVDAGNGMAGHTVPAVLGPIPALTLVELFFELDGDFPNHEANPIDPATLVDLQRRVLAEGADLGLAFDGDADRCFVIDEAGGIVSPSTLTALIAAAELRREPGASVIHNLITSRAVPEIIRENGGTPVRTRVGHSFIKAEMARTGAVFGGEHSGHFYFRDFWRADSGMLAALYALAAVGSTDRPASAIFAEFTRYVASGEINTVVTNPVATSERIAVTFAGRPGVDVDRLDGVTVSAADWWFNVRASNTEPLLRLNVEAVDAETMSRLRDDVLAVIAEEA